MSLFALACTTSPTAGATGRALDPGTGEGAVKVRGQACRHASTRKHKGTQRSHQSLAAPCARPSRDVGPVAKHQQADQARRLRGTMPRHEHDTTLAD